MSIIGKMIKDNGGDRKAIVNTPKAIGDIDCKQEFNSPHLHQENKKTEEKIAKGVHIHMNDAGYVHFVPDCLCTGAIDVEATDVTDYQLTLLKRD